jgi:hypothetical protein
VASTPPHDLSEGGRYGNLVIRTLGHLGHDVNAACQSWCLHLQQIWCQTPAQSRRSRPRLISSMSGLLLPNRPFNLMPSGHTSGTNLPRAYGLHADETQRTERARTVSHSPHIRRCRRWSSGAQQDLTPECVCPEYCSARTVSQMPVQHAALEYGREGQTVSHFSTCFLKMGSATTASTSASIFCWNCAGERWAGQVCMLRAVMRDILVADFQSMRETSTHNIPYPSWL